MCLVSLARITNSDASTASGQRSESLRSRNEEGLSGPSVNNIVRNVSSYFTPYSQEQILHGRCLTPGRKLGQISELAVVQFCSQNQPTSALYHAEYVLFLKLTSWVFRVSVSFGTLLFFSAHGSIFSVVFVSYSLRVGEGRGRFHEPSGGGGGG